jgi:hypothetical protein
VAARVSTRDEKQVLAVEQRKKMMFVRYGPWPMNYSLSNVASTPTRVVYR